MQVSWLRDALGEISRELLLICVVVRSAYPVPHLPLSATRVPGRAQSNKRGPTESAHEIPTCSSHENSVESPTAVDIARDTSDTAAAAADQGMSYENV